MEQTVDVLIISSSRPEVLEYCLDSFNRRLKGCQKRFYINEDVTNQERSSRIEEIVSRLGISAEICRNKTPKGPCIAIADFSKVTKCKYFFVVEDDWELEDDIRVDSLIKIMDHHENISEIVLKYKEKIHKSKEQVDEEGYKLYLYETPLASPGLWRKSKLIESLANRAVYKLVYETPFHVLRVPALFPQYYAKINAKYSDEKMLSWLRDDIGVYGIKVPHNQVRHLGGTWKTFLPKEEEKQGLLLQELDARYISGRSTQTPPDARPINGVIPFDEKYAQTQLDKMGKRKSEYIYYLKSLLESGALSDPRWRGWVDGIVNGLSMDCQ
jgi:hypothetical protein